MQGNKFESDLSKRFDEWDAKDKGCLKKILSLN